MTADLLSMTGSMLSFRFSRRCGFWIQGAGRSAFWLVLLLGLVSLTGCGSKPTVTIVCPWAPGGGTDQLSRLVADQLQQRMETPVIVVNRDGGSGAIGHTAVAKADPDGRTIGMLTAELSTMHQMGICELTYRDYDCLMQLNGDPAAILVKKDAPWKNLTEFLEHIREHPGDVKMSGTATGGLWDLARVGMQHKAGIPIESVIWVPTKGAAPSLVQLMGGHIDGVCCSVPEAASQLEAGELRVLAVFSEDRLPEFPDDPTAKEQGLDWVAVGWRGLALPKGTPEPVRQDLLKHLNEIAKSKEFLEFMKQSGYRVTIKGPDEFTKFLQEQETQWKPIVEAAGYAK